MISAYAGIAREGIGWTRLSGNNMVAFDQIDELTSGEVDESGNNARGRHRWCSDRAGGELSVRTEVDGFNFGPGGFGLAWDRRVWVPGCWGGIFRNLDA